MVAREGSGGNHGRGAARAGTSATALPVHSMIEALAPVLLKERE